MSTGNQSPTEADEFDEVWLRASLEKKYTWQDLDQQMAGNAESAGSAYTNECPQKYRKWYQYFAVLNQKKEKSPRLMDITKLLLVICSSNYYALMARLDCFRELNSPLENEVELINELLRGTPKEYHLWNYRKSLKPELHVDREHEFLDQLLKEDSKNYHVWSYRVWLMGRATPQEQKEDLQSIETRIEQNWQRFKECYSAWSYRRFLQGKLGLLAEKSIIDKEVQHLLDYLGKQPENECVWNTLNSIFQQSEFGLVQYPIRSVNYSQYPSIAKTIIPITNRFSLHTQLKIAQQAGNSAVAKALIEQLKESDKTRSTYWSYLLERY